MPSRSHRRPVSHRRVVGRRAFVGLVGTGSLLALAGCQSASPGTGTPTPTPAPTGTPTASSTPSPTPGPSLADLPPERRFDFWPGSWRGDDGTTRTVYPLLGGTLLLEVGVAADGTDAMAMTFDDPVTGAWQRRVVAADGRVVRLSGGLEGSAVVLTGTRSAADGSRTPVRESFEPTAPGVVYRSETRGDDPSTRTSTFTRDGDAPDRPAPSASRIDGSHEAVEDRPPARRFDFWVGEWVVYRGESKVGDSVVQHLLDGALVLENWMGGGGGTGHSFNYYDPATATWTQTWVASNGSWLEIDGEFADGAMRLVGEQYSPSGSTQGYRGVWTPDADGSVTQELSTSSDGETWRVGFTGDYRPAT